MPKDSAARDELIKIIEEDLDEWSPFEDREEQDLLAYAASVDPDPDGEMI